jgi:uncharacterized repeat protein (TIGR01451 family)
MRNPERSTRHDSRLFAELAEGLLRAGTPVRFRAEGASMRPNLKGGELVTVAPLNRETLRCGDIVLTRGDAGFQAHRVVTLGSRENSFETRGDAGWGNEPDDGRTILGRVTTVESDDRSTRLDSRASHLRARARRAWAHLSTAAVLRVKRIIPFAVFMAFSTVLVLAWAAPAAAQADLSLTQTASVSTIPVSTNFTYTESVTNNGPNTVATGTMWVYLQTPADTNYQAAAGTNWTCGTVPAVGGAGAIVCTYNAALASGATASNLVITLQVNGTTASGTTIEDSATVTATIADPTPANNTAISTILVEPTGDADLSVSMTAVPTPVFVVQNLAYTIQVQNLGPAATTSETLTDTIPAGTTYVSATPSAGTCAGTATVTCSPGAIAAGASVTITIVVTSPSTASTLTNTAQITASAPTDPVTTNNSATKITVVQPLVCASPGHDGAGSTLGGIVNAYYPGTGTVAAGATSITLGAVAAGGAQTAIASGDLLLVIQMQDAAINTTNTGAYGDGSPGDPATGSTNLNSSGEFEFVTATNAVPITGGALTLEGTGSGGGLLNSYVSHTYATTTTEGQQTFQVIRVPQYTSATLSSTLAPLAWNGSVGGVLALDVATQLTLNGATVATDGMGFRGGAGRNLAGAAGLDTDYRTLATAATNGSKGEGIAGTPRYITPSTVTVTTTATDTGVEGYTNGSYARGAPATAGGGGTDGDPPDNNDNSGGGAGGNGGAGGFGGYGWDSYTFGGGFGGAAFPASTSALVMGGGGGAGTTNDGSYYISAANHGADCGADCTGIYSSGVAGGGIVIIRAGSVAGTGTVTANGLTALNTDNDGSGAGGAGGSILIFANSGNLAGLTVNANGGSGGDPWPEEAGTTFPGNRHGPGGGGGGGVILLSATPAAAAVNGGINGYTTTSNDSYGATPGKTGITQTNLIITETPGTQSGAYCASADLAVTNSGAPNPVAAGGTITYTQKVTNNGPLDAVNAVFSEAVPANATFNSMAPPAGWTCGTLPPVGGTGNIVCTNPDVADLAAGTFTLVVTVNSSTIFGSQVVDVASVTSGTNDSNLANNTATAVNMVGTATSANVGVTISASPSPVVQVGNNITYTITAQNLGPAASSNVVFNDLIPANTTFVSATPPAGWSACTSSGGTISCSIASMPSGGPVTFTVVLNVTAGTPSGTVITNQVSVNGTTPDPNPANNTAQVSVTVASATQADLSVTSSASPNPVLAGNQISYVQTVTNNGPASATSVTFTDTNLTNTTFVSLGVPAGWTCPTIPAVGGTVNISCCPGSAGVCSGAAVTSGTTVNFPLVVKVTATTPPGTGISNTASISSTTSDPNSANNTVTTTVYVTSPTEADVAIVKTAAPEPVDQGANLTYMIQVTNNGPAIAQGVSVSDPIPGEVTYVSVSTTLGTCSESAGTVTCAVGTLSVGGVAIITINVTAESISTASPSTNTATVTSTTTDPDSSNNTSSSVSTIQYPTAVEIASMRAMARRGGGVVLEWRTREEVRNLGFHVFREDAEGRHQLNPSMIAGSALFMRGGSSPHNAKTYRWLDLEGGPHSMYWIEDVDLNGTRAMHGPVYPDSTYDETIPISPSPLLKQINKLNALVGARVMHWIPKPRPVSPIRGPGEVPLSWDTSAAVKISVSEEGWYSVSRSQLVAAGLDPGADARFLQLYAEGVEQPILILGNQAGALGPNDSIEFYGTGIDTPFSDTRVYWLVEGGSPGKRITTIVSPGSGQVDLQSFPFTVVLEQRTTYVAALLNGENADNFFGAVVTSEPVDQDLTVVHNDASSSIPVTLDVTLQGAMDGQGHGVAVSFNGTSLGEMDFNGIRNSTNTFSVDASLLHDGTNTVTLTALEGENDVSLVQSIALHYAHTYEVDSNWLPATAPGGGLIHIGGFTSAQIHVFDITDPGSIAQITGVVKFDGASYGVTLMAPGGSGAERTLLAFSDDQISSPSALSYHPPSSLLASRGGADIVIISHPDFVASLAPLVNLRESEGHEVALVTVDEIFNAFNYGERSPFAIQDYLQWASTQWRTPPEAILLVGGASFDPRNYLGFGDFDFVPTRIIETAAFKTASDDWFTDFKQTGFATIPTGRLPVRTTADAALAVSKIVNYDQNSSYGAWTRQAVFIADQNIGADFTTEASIGSAALPASTTVTKILADGQDPATVQQQILTALNDGALIVNYTGHGSEEQWSFVDLFDNSSATSLANGDRLPVYLLMACLNGLFDDVYATSLSTSILLAPSGGAVAVWASSGFTEAAPQASMDQSLLHILVANPSISIGRAILQAKSGITDQDVRRTWILFGDPAMRIPWPATAPQRISPGPRLGVPGRAPSRARAAEAAANR